MPSNGCSLFGANFILFDYLVNVGAGWIRFGFTYLEIFQVPESKPDNASHDDDHQRKDFGGREKILHLGRRLDVPTVHKRQNA